MLFLYFVDSLYVLLKFWTYGSFTLRMSEGGSWGELSCATSASVSAWFSRWSLQELKKGFQLLTILLMQVIYNLNESIRHVHIIQYFIQRSFVFLSKLICVINFCLLNKLNMDCTFWKCVFSLVVSLLIQFHVLFLVKFQLQLCILKTSEVFRAVVKLSHKASFLLTKQLLI